MASTMSFSPPTCWPVAQRGVARTGTTTKAARNPWQFLAIELRGAANQPVFADADLRHYVNEQIGYEVVSRSTALLVFAGVFVGLAAGAVALGRTALLEHLGWLGPALALSGA